jgi:hypothetical protein
LDLGTTNWVIPQEAIEDDGSTKSVIIVSPDLQTHAASFVSSINEKFRCLLVTGLELKESMEHEQPAVGLRFESVGEPKVARLNAVLTARRAVPASAD